MRHHPLIYVGIVLALMFVIAGFIRPATDAVPNPESKRAITTHER